MGGFCKGFSCRPWLGVGKETEICVSSLVGQLALTPLPTPNWIFLRRR